MSVSRLARRATTACAAVGLALWLPASAGTQTANSTPAGDATPAGGTPPASDYTYDARGRRDPFVSLLGRGESTTPRGQRLEGIQGLTTAELVVRGVLQSQGGYVAIVTGPDQKTHRLRSGDRIADGTINAITPQGLVIVQEVNDPLSLVKQREIRKTLNGSDEGK